MRLRNVGRSRPLVEGFRQSGWDGRLLVENSGVACGDSDAAIIMLVTHMPRAVVPETCAVPTTACRSGRAETFELCEGLERPRYVP
ncbi:hypothetical protein CRG98_046072 [Punica granatum]|uniref:Uncharacterized protein n=1 Tax=Punica granatum TaxID=22663 RepID=A0A2I0HQF8_PUNGR|nr:hypothetical protein CRG98_046072 [Punica granatum]